MSIDINKPRYDQDTYIGRAYHFFRLTNPLNVFATEKELNEAKVIVEAVKYSHKVPKGYTEDQVWRMKYLYDSAFHPDTGEKMILIGRMAAQAPMNTIITGGMVTFYKTTAATVFWQWINQTFNAIVNFTNRSGDAPLSKSAILTSYLCACGGALTTALYLNSKVKNMKNPVYARLVPFAAVCGANFINIPMMRNNELRFGTPVTTKEGEKLGNSTRAAFVGIGLVCISRILMATPGMILTPLIMNWATNAGWFCKRPNAMVPFQIALVGLCVTFATPLCCAIFPQMMYISPSSLEPHIQEAAKKRKAEYVYFNKGL
ncbi:sideroflexin-1-3-like [Pectinophora gossypiella]|uniref:sideroflexin-1-3-like n=1 Tax=Pectinophora gossypiella TaxID=13191 RepID=UPI00214F20D6|nr:sideroflexin-1-3-like [Pectinophora gossypiella]XP_049880808.1 sideroflexin-1-3-like [Pectinophora gossypiella]